MYVYIIDIARLKIYILCKIQTKSEIQKFGYKKTSNIDHILNGLAIFRYAKAYFDLLNIQEKKTQAIS